MASKSASIGTLSVGGTGRVEVTPDVARIQLSVITQATTAQETAAQNAKIAGAVIDRIKALGIKGGAIQTAGLNLSPVIEYRDGPDQGKTIGYRAENTVEVVSSVALAGQVFDEGVAAGANQSSGFSLELKDESEARAQALAAASKALLADAEAIADALGLKLLGPKSIEIQDVGRPVIFAKSLARDAAPSTPIAPGRIAVTAQVRAVFEYRTA